MGKPHKHAELIKAWADGAEIQRLYDADKWHDDIDPNWSYDEVYRIKPEPKPDVVKYLILRECHGYTYLNESCNTVAIFDGETGKLKSVGVL